jgi:hypothetical protein
MVRHFRLTALIAMSLAAWPQSAHAAQSAPKAPDAIYKLEGTVVNAATGRPVPRALVELTGAGKRAVLTDSQGEFSFDKLSKGPVKIQVEKPGFFEPGIRRDAKVTHTIEVGPESGKMVLKLEPESMITGQVTDESRDPVEGAIVDVIAEQIVDGRRQLQTPDGRNVHTDDDGRFLMAGLPPGKYILRVKAGNGARRSPGGQAGNAGQSYPLQVFFPGVTDLASATAIDLVAGQHAHAQVSISKVPAFKLSGSVLGNLDFRNVVQPAIFDALGERLAMPDHWDTRTGAFEFPPLPAGVYTLQIQQLPDDRHEWFLTRTVTLNRDVSRVTLSQAAGVSIPVSVRTEFTATEAKDCPSSGSEGKTPNCKQFPAGISIVSSDLKQMMFHATPEKAEPSTLSLPYVMPGKYRVEVHPKVRAYVRSVRSGTTDLLREELVVPAGGAVSPIEVVLRDDGAKVKIHVAAENLPQQAHVLLVPEFAPNQPALTLTASSSGDLQYDDLAPGDYKVLAFESPEEIEYQNPDVMRKYAGKTARITLPAKGSTSVTVELIRQGE